MPDPSTATTPSAPRATDRTSSLDLSQRDLTLDIARVLCVLLVVVIHLFEVGVGIGPAGLTISRPAENQPWFAPATWIGQIMPLFFVVGGFASITAWRSLRRRGGTAADYMRTRVLRLAQPTLPLFVFYIVVIAGARLFGAPADLVTTVVIGAGMPLWFIAAYTLCQACVPIMATLHTRAPVTTVIVLAVGAGIVDATRLLTHSSWVGLFNLFFVWVLVQQIGFWHADGWFAARRWWTLLLIAAGSYAGIAGLVFGVGMSPNMLVNLNPPMTPLILLGLAQACLLRLVRPLLARLMNTHPARAVVFLVGSRLMTIYLWHLPVIIALSGIALLIPGASPLPGSSAWWWSRAIVYVLVFVILFGVSFLVARWETPKVVGPTPPILVEWIAAALTFTPAFAVLEWGLDLPFAIGGALCFGAAILLLGRWKSLLRPFAPHAITPRTRSRADRLDVGRISRTR